MFADDRNEPFGANKRRNVVWVNNGLQVNEWDAVGAF